MYTSQSCCLLIGVDAGSRDAIRPLACHPLFLMQSIDSPDADQAGYWDEVYRSQKIVGIVVGTSDSARGRNIETAARTAATRCNVIIVAVEDYAGNYFDVPHSKTALLVVESPLSEQLYRDRLGTTCPPISILVSPRYDQYRANVDSLRTITRMAWQRPQQPLQILWAGQPESQDCLEALRRVAPALRATKATLLLKAHPRDSLVGHGVYEKLLNHLGVHCIDVSALTVAESLEKAPQLVMTQFSAVAIEAGFYGIPTLHLLYDDIGGRRLLQKKGYALPMHCQYGASFALQTKGCEEKMLSAALFNHAARGSVLDHFDDFFQTRTETASILTKHLVKLISKI